MKNARRVKSVLYLLAGLCIQANGQIDSRSREGNILYLSDPAQQGGMVQLEWDDRRVEINLPADGSAVRLENRK
ncbi:MAG: hypothetical protein AAGU19_22645 [Prolixibacteraceae bacterium]